MTYEVALVVGLTAVLTDKVHGVAAGNVLGMVLHKLLDAIPQGRDRLVVLVQTDDKTVLLVVFLHKAEWVMAHVAEELNAGLHAPVVLVVHHERMAEEEAGLVAAHMAIALRITVDDILATHLLSHRSGLVLVNPLWIGPVLFGNLAIVCGAGSQRGGELLKIVIELLIVQEHPVVVVIAIEAIFNGPNGLGDVPDIGVAGKGNKCRIDPLTAVRADIVWFLRFEIVVGGLRSRE